MLQPVSHGRGIRTGALGHGDGDHGLQCLSGVTVESVRVHLGGTVVHLGHVADLHQLPVSDCEHHG